MGFFSERVAPVLLLLLVNFLFSGYAVFASTAFKYGSISPIVFALLRDTVASLCFGSSLLISQRAPESERGPLVPAREHVFLFLALGFLGVFSSLFGALSIKLTSSSIYGLFTPVVPCITLVVSLLIGIESIKLNEAASWAKMIGICLAAGGAVTIVLFDSNGSHGGRGTWIGYVYLLLQKTGVSTCASVMRTRARVAIGGRILRAHQPCRHSLRPSFTKEDASKAAVRELDAGGVCVFLWRVFNFSQRDHFRGFCERLADDGVERRRNPFQRRLCVFF